MPTDDSDVEDLDENLRVRLRKRLSRPISSDEEDEEGEMLDEDREFINDDEDDALEEGETSDVEKSQVDDANEEEVNVSESETLDEDDLDLIQENLGIRHKAKRRRVVMEKDDDEDSAAEDHPASVQHDADEAVDDFIVDEDQEAVGMSTIAGAPGRESKRYGAAMQDAHEIFGVDYMSEQASDVPVRAPEPEQIYEPSELEQNLLTEFDTEVKLEDKPERFKLRRPYPVSPANEEELELESQWVASKIFIRKDHENYKQSPNIVKKVKQVLNFLKNEFLEVPFIATYRKENILPELCQEDLWKIWELDEQWAQLSEQRKRLKASLEQTHSDQVKRALNSADDELHDDTMRPVEDADIEWLMQASSAEDLNDISAHFRMYYGLEGEFEKSSQRRQPYFLFRHLIPFAKRLGLHAQHFAGNVLANFKKFEPDQYYLDPMALAQDFVGMKDANGVVRPATSTPADIINAAIQVAAEELAADPRVRSVLRKAFFERALIDVHPTDHGLLTLCDGSEADQHPCRPMLFIRGKPVKMIKEDDFLQLTVGKNQRLLTFRLYVTQDMEEQLRKFVLRDEYTSLAERWNELRQKALHVALDKFMYPLFERELSSKLLKEAENFVIARCRQRLGRLVEYGPLKYLWPSNEDETQRTLSIDYDGNTAALVLITTTGQIDQIQFVCLSGGKACQAFVDAIEKIKQERKILSVLLSAEDLRCLHLRRILNNKCTLCEMTVPRVFQDSRRAEQEFRDQPALVRRAVSMFRFLRDPLLEVCQLANLEMDLCCLPLHSLQLHIDRQQLYDHLCRELINKISNIGIDMNRCIQEPNTAGALQFVSGLGPRKANHLLKMIARHGQLTNRSELITVCKMGPKVFINCAGFIKIDPRRLSDDNDVYVEFLDSTRIHPEAYEWARKMAVDGLEYDDSAAALATSTPGNASAALEEIVETPERLKELDLDAFAAELARTGYGDKSVTLYDIRSELINRFNDMRPLFKPLSGERLFYAVLRESPDTFNTGTLVSAQVIQVVTRPPASEDIENLNAVQTPDGTEQCPYCAETIANQLDLWNHVEHQCPGIPVGVRVSFECANQRLQGFVPVRLLADSSVFKAAKLRRGETILCRVHKLDFEKINCILSTRDVDLQTERDPYNDSTAEKEGLERSNMLSLQIRSNRLDHGQEAKSYIPRVVVHPSFRNVDFQEAERLLSSEFEVGEALIRPSSSKGHNYLTLTFKLNAEPLITRHYSVKETDKQHAFTVGRKLFIDDEEFEDLDEIMARFVSPMAAFLREICSFKNFLPNGNDTELSEMVRWLSEEKAKSNRIPYCLCISRRYPGSVMLCYMPANQPIQEYISIKHSGLKFRNHEFSSLLDCLNWFKRNYRQRQHKTPDTPTRRPTQGFSEIAPQQAPATFNPEPSGYMPPPHGAVQYQPAAPPPQVNNYVDHYEAMAPPPINHGPPHVPPHAPPHAPSHAPPHAPSHAPSHAPPLRQHPPFVDSKQQNFRNFKRSDEQWGEQAQQWGRPREPFDEYGERRGAGPFRRSQRRPFNGRSRGRGGEFRGGNFRSDEYRGNRDDFRGNKDDFRGNNRSMRRGFGSRRPRRGGFQDNHSSPRDFSSGNSSFGRGGRRPSRRPEGCRPVAEDNHIELKDDWGGPQRESPRRGRHENSHQGSPRDKWPVATKLEKNVLEMDDWGADGEVKPQESDRQRDATPTLHKSEDGFYEQGDSGAPYNPESPWSPTDSNGYRGRGARGGRRRMGGDGFARRSRPHSQHSSPRPSESPFSSSTTAPPKEGAASGIENLDSWE